MLLDIIKDILKELLGGAVGRFHPRHIIKDHVEDRGDTEWMNIWIKTQNGGTKNSLGYHYVINREVIDGSRSKVLKSTGDASYEQAGEAEYKVSGNVMFVKVPLSALGLSEDNYDIEFKVSDNVKATVKTNILEFYNSGDSAPIGGLNYKFGY